MKVNTFNIELKNNDVILKDLMNSIEIIHTNGCTGFILDVNKKIFTILEKFIFDTAMFHFNKLGIVFSGEKYYIETDVKVDINGAHMHIDNDHFKYTNYVDNQQDDEDYNYISSKGPNPFITTVSYLNGNYEVPTIIANIDSENFLNKDFGNSQFHVSFPRKLKNILFEGGKYFHTAFTTKENICNEERYTIVTVYWRYDDLVKEKIRYLDNDIFPEKLLYNLNKGIALKNTNNCLTLNEYINSKCVFYDKDKLSNADIENLFKNIQCKKMRTIINDPDLIGCYDIIVKPIELSIKNEKKSLDFLQLSNIIVLSVATDPKNKGLQYFIKSLKKQKISYKLLGLNEIWNGGDLEKYPGGGQKVNLLKKELKTWDIETLKNTLLLHSDSYDVINVSSDSEIIQKYKRISNGSVLFTAEKYCWPDENLKKYYPITNSEYKYLNSGGFIGNAYDILNLLQMEINDNDDDQLYFTKTYLFDNEKPKIKIDYNCEIFQTLHGSSKNDIYFYKNRIVNKQQNSLPCFIHGNGSTKELLYNIAKYIL